MKNWKLAKKVISFVEEKIFLNDLKNLSLIGNANSKILCIYTLCIYAHIHAYVHICMYTYIHTHAYIRVYVCIRVCSK